MKPRKYALVGVAVLLSCGEPPTQAPSKHAASWALEPVEETDVSDLPTAEQERALANSLHRAHLEGEKPAKCQDCHAVAGMASQPFGVRCATCHEDHGSAIHGDKVDIRAKDCVNCHDFLAEQVNPWQCGNCHVKVTGDAPWGNAPKIQVHAKERCGSCHIAHGDRAMAASPCQNCHEKLTLDHDDGVRKGRAQCQQCHEEHTPGVKAQATCEGCHGEKIPATALVKGHDTCSTCHAPHQPNGQKSCESCHEQIKTAGAVNHAEHQLCTSCHEPHAVKASAAPSCAKCHERVPSARHPADPQQGACLGCHPVHQANGTIVAKSCTSCHEAVSKSPEIHTAKITCAACHDTHGPAEPLKDGKFCASCHVDTGKPSQFAGPMVAPVEGHQACDGCHEESGHALTRAVVGCSSCHEVEQKSAFKGHTDCQSCHRSHDGEVKKGCVDCHSTQKAGIHQKDLTPCQQCHRPHGPEGVATPRPCQNCHESPLPMMHMAPGHDRCSDCHEFHDQKPPATRTNCEGCHDDKLDHYSDSPQCLACHPFRGSRS